MKALLKVFPALLILLLWLILSLFVSAKEAAPQPQNTIAKSVRMDKPLIVSETVVTETETDEAEKDSEEIEALAILIYQEAGGNECSDDTRLKVASVALNRMESHYFPNTIYEVATQYGQYGRLYWTGLKWPERAQLPEEQDAVCRAYAIARCALAGDRPLPKDVIYQAEFPQGKEIVCFQDGTYFCR